MADHICISAVVVDGAARRFVDEGLGGVYITNRIAQLPDPLSAVVIFDERIWNGPARDFILPANPNLITAGANIMRSDSLSGLASQLGLPAGALERTVADYNAALETNAAAALEPPRTTTAHKAYPISQGPFYAMRLVAGITFTMGGIAIDETARVLNEQDTPIAGLYAAGCTTGGLEGGPLAGYVGGLAKSAVMAMRASDHIAANRT
jgi:fumarate reductase flavoprotein subunit